MSKGLTRAGFDIDLLDGTIRESAFVEALGRVGYLVEHKRDWRAKDTGRVFIEHSQHGRPSGIATSIADWWAIEFATDCWICLPTDRVRALHSLALRQGFRRRGGDFDEFEGAAIPVYWLTRSDTLLEESA